MSLLVWLPLTGDLHNQGISNISIENMGAVTSNASGKIGSCMSFTGTATSYLRLSPILSTGDCSIAFWAKLNSSSTAHTFYSQRTAANSTGFTIFSLTSGNLRFDDGSALEVAGIGTNVWHHVVCCRDSAKKYVYVDGVLKGSAAKGNPSPNVNYSLIGGSQNTAGGSASQGTTNALSGYLNDIRIYDHCLSVAEIHEIAQGLVLHYKLDDLTNGVIDSSGYNYNGQTVGTLSLSSDTPRYSDSVVLSGDSTAINCGRSFNVQGALEATWSGWFYLENWRENEWHYLLSSQESGGILLGSYSGTTIRARAHAYTNEDKSTRGYIDANYAFSQTDIPSNSGWHMLTGVYTTSNIKLYIDGILKKTTSTTTYGIHFNTGANMYIGAECSGTEILYPCNCQASDVRLYYTALSAEDILSLYHTSAKVDNLDGLHTFEFQEDEPAQVTKQGQIKGDIIQETYSPFAYDIEMYVEPDGSKWAHVFHHNNPTEYKFASTDTFTSSVYIDENRWFNFKSCDYLDKYEFLAKVKRTSTDTEVKYRWIQPESPLTSTFANTKSDSVTKITTTGYTSCPFGGLYHVAGSSWLAMNNGTNNNWYGATGAWTAWNGGIPGWAATGSSNAITSGSIDIYVRLDNASYSSLELPAKLFKDFKWQGNNLIEL